MASPDDRFRCWHRRLVVGILLALPLVLLAIAAGISPRRLWPVAGFLTMAAGMVGYDRVARRARERLVHRLKQTPPPIGVRLRKPFWLRAELMALFLEFVAIVCAIVAAIGFPQVAFGILLALGGFGTFSGTMFSGPDLTFEPAGLRLHFGATHFLVPWIAIRLIEPVGPVHYQMVRLRVAEMDRIRDSVLPATPRSRKRIKDAFSISGDEILLMPWTAGLDGQTLERAIPPRTGRQR